VATVTVAVREVVEAAWADAVAADALAAAREAMSGAVSEAAGKADGVVVMMARDAVGGVTSEHTPGVGKPYAAGRPNPASCWIEAQASTLLADGDGGQQMTDKPTQQSPAEGNMKKDPDNWVTGEEPMTGAQRSYLKTLSEEAKQPFDDSLTKAAASRRIDELQAQTGRHPPDQEPSAGAATVQAGSSSRTAAGDSGTAAGASPADPAHQRRSRERDDG
jgi:hypothetical protein